MQVPSLPARLQTAPAAQLAELQQTLSTQWLLAHSWFAAQLAPTSWPQISVAVVALL